MLYVIHSKYYLYYVSFRHAYRDSLTAECTEKTHFLSQNCSPESQLSFFNFFFFFWLQNEQISNMNYKAMSTLPALCQCRNTNIQCQLLVWIQIGQQKQPFVVVQYNPPPMYEISYLGKSTVLTVQRHSQKGFCWYSCIGQRSQLFTVLNNIAMLAEVCNIDIALM